MTTPTDVLLKIKKIAEDSLASREAGCADEIMYMENIIKVLEDHIGCKIKATPYEEWHNK